MDTQMHQFWWRWLLVVMIGVIVFALGFIFLPDVMQDFFDKVIFAAPPVTDRFGDEAAHYIKFVNGVLGAVMVGWMTALLPILLRPFRRGEREAWNTVTLSIVIWFVTDSAFSLWMGFPQNAYFNVLFFVLFIIPLAATYRHFYRK
jgi:hypothetical protein